MGRLFKIDLEGRLYKCKHCQIEFIEYDDLATIPFITYMASLGKLYCFTKFFNLVIETAKVTIYMGGEVDHTMHPLFCIGCGSHLGFCYKDDDDTEMYSEGYFYINRFEILGPPEGSDDENPGNEEE